MVDKKVVLVVGTNGYDNIGAAVVQKFKTEGWCVITADMRDDTDLWINVTKKNQVQDAFKHIKEIYGRLDAVVPCHGTNILGKIEEYDEDNWDKTINVNLKGLFLLLQAYVQHFDNDGLRKVFLPVTSDTSEIPKTSTFAYGASKAGANHFLRCTARELNKYHKDQWLVSGLAIGMVFGTPMDKKTISDLMEQRDIWEEEARGMLTANIPIGRGLTTDEVAEWLYFVTEKGDYATGNILRIDAGQCQG
jgi:NAD(P)-dependent dehydrogenase (short-subunit alcohol dehydrogenase family)